MLSIGFYKTEAERSPPVEFLDGLPTRDRYYIQADLATFAQHGDRAPISIKAITGHSPMREIRTGGFRTFFVRIGNEVCVLGICKKQNQDREIKVCAKRMKRWLETRKDGGDDR